MTIQELRVQRGWSQEQLASHAGLSIRTIQRIENGATASLESLKCLAAVFETSVANLMQEMTMTTTENPNATELEREAEALKYVENLKGLYIHGIIFALITPCLGLLNYVISPHALWVHYVAIPWLLALGFQGAMVFSVSEWFGPDWEQRKFRQRVNRH